MQLLLCNRLRYIKRQHETTVYLNPKSEPTSFLSIGSGGFSSDAHVEHSLRLRKNQAPRTLDDKISEHSDPEIYRIKIKVKGSGHQALTRDTNIQAIILRHA